MGRGFESLPAARGREHRLPATSPGVVIAFPAASREDSVPPRLVICGAECAPAGGVGGMAEVLPAVVGGVIFLLVLK